MRDSIRRRLLGLAAAFGLGVPAVGMVALATTPDPGGRSYGFPFVWSTMNGPCSRPNPFNGCGFTYSIPIVLLDYAILVAVIFVLVSIIHILWIRFSKVSTP